MAVTVRCVILPAEFGVESAWGYMLMDDSARQVVVALRSRACAWLLFSLCHIGIPALACTPPASPVGEEPPELKNAAEGDPPPAQPAALRKKPRTQELAAQRRAMVKNQIRARGVKDATVLEAMSNVPRHWFVPAGLRHLAYRDQPLPIGENQTISQPYIVALMTEVLRLTPDSKVLEIGTGSGYQAAVLSEITPHVFTIEIVEPLARRAIASFTKHGYNTIRTRIGDGYGGWAEHAPFDAIVVTCAPDHIPPELPKELRTGGRICIPVGSEHGVQELVVVTKLEDGSLKRESLIPVRFVPMTGEAQNPPPNTVRD